MFLKKGESNRLFFFFSRPVKNVILFYSGRRNTQIIRDSLGECNKNKNKKTRVIFDMFVCMFVLFVLFFPVIFIYIFFFLLSGHFLFSSFLTHFSFCSNSPPPPLPHGSEEGEEMCVREREEGIPFSLSFCVCFETIHRKVIKRIVKP